MPEISRFLGIIVAIFYDDHPPPHFHARYGDFQIKIDIVTRDVLAGHLPRRALSHVREWHNLHQDELMECWRRAEAQELIGKIEPLE